MTVPDTLARVLSSPSGADLWRLRADLLEAGLAPGSRVWTVLGEFQRFLEQLATGSSSREYSNLASMLDIGALGGVFLEQVLEQKDPKELSLRLFSAILSEGLMVLATRQHVKAWEGELNAVYRGAAWYLYEELWRWAEELKPDLAARERRRLLDALLQPVHSQETGGLQKAVLLGRLFQILLVSYLSQETAHLDIE